MKQINETDVNRMAQYFYEAVMPTGDVFFPSMTAKGTIVDGLKDALVRVGVAVVPDNTWTIAYLHDGCPSCEACAEAAIDHANAHFLVSDSWTELTNLGGVDSIAHRAIVERA
jgi:hypothetical protein